MNQTKNKIINKMKINKMCNEMTQKMIKYPMKAWFSNEDAMKALLTRDYVFLGREGNKTLLGYYQVKVNIIDGEMMCDEAEKQVLENELESKEEWNQIKKIDTRKPYQTT
jgi:hypothetical protein